MSTERPFGDPTNIQRENAAAVGKGVAFGCGGCALLVVLVFGLMMACMFFAFVMLWRSGPGDAAFEAAKKSEVMREALGEPMTKGWLVTGNVSINNNTGTADLNVPVSGPNGSASIHAVATMTDGVWNFSEAKATIGGHPEPVDLRPLLNAPPDGALRP
jgi:hypothetical protein